MLVDKLVLDKIIGVMLNRNYVAINILQYDGSTDDKGS